MLTEVDLGVPIDLILPEAYVNHDQSGRISQAGRTSQTGRTSQAGRTRQVGRTSLAGEAVGEALTASFGVVLVWEGEVSQVVSPPPTSHPPPN